MTRKSTKSNLTYVQNELSHFTKHLIAIVPDAVEPKHLAVQLQELSKSVHVTRRLCNLRQCRLLAGGRVGIFWIILRRIYLNTFTFKILLVTKTCALLNET